VCNYVDNKCGDGDSHANLNSNGVNFTNFTTCTKLTGNDTTFKRVDALLDEKDASAGLSLTWTGGDNVTGSDPVE
jgi:hypothetical protein